MNLGGGILSLIMLIAAVVCFVLAAVPHPTIPSRLVAWGLAFWAGSALVARLGG